MTEEREQKFMFVLRQALLMIVRWIEKEYGIADKPRGSGPSRPSPSRPV